MVLSENIIHEPCFTEDDRQNYYKYKDIIGDKLPVRLLCKKII